MIPLYICLLALLIYPVLSVRPVGLHFVGIGYNILKGNPDGGIASRGGVDPGLFLTRRIFEISPGDAPVEVVYEPRYSCARIQTTSVFYGTKSYQKKLSLGVKSSGAADVILASFAFSLSAGYISAHDETYAQHNVFQDDQNVCNLGRARFAEELAESDNFNVSRGFASAICSLPLMYNQSAYMQFLNNWGTHITMEVELGSKTINRSRSTLSQFVEHIMKNAKGGVSIGGSYMGYSASLGVNFENFKDSNTYKISFGTYQYTLTSGSQNLPEPIGLRVISIDEALVEKYWRNSLRFLRGGQCHDDVKQHLGSLRLNLIQALSEYASYMMAPQATDPPLMIPVTWPAGSYGLLKPKTGCPQEQNFHWYEGWRHQDSEDMSIYGNKFSNPLNMYGEHDAGSVTQWFCIKGQRTVSDFDINWPHGDYCIMKYGTCPVGFTEGYIKWDDDDPFNDDTKEGVLPDGKYDDGNTLIEYCCRNDGLPTEPIVLPSDRPFYLFQYTRGCQMISGMNVSEEFVDFNTEDFLNKDELYGAHPFDDGESTRHRLHLCYYNHPLPASIIG